jgi:hypothetical protein
MKNFRYFLLILAVGSLLATGCLTCEKKEYTFVIHSDGTVTLTIRYVNIVVSRSDSMPADSAYRWLVEEYLQGNKIEAEYPTATDVKKRLFEEKGVLCGEITMNFPSLESAGLYKYNEGCPIMFGLFMEEYLTSNGEYGGDRMPVIFWGNELKELKLTSLVEKQADSAISLLKAYRKAR